MALYHARHRPAAELAPIAESVLGEGGRVAIDPRSAALILSGPRADVERALGVLARLDRRLRTLVLEYSVEEQGRLEAAGLRVDWGARRGALRVGSLLGGEVPALAAGASRSATDRGFRARLRLLEGEAGVLATGATVAATGGLGAELRAESGFEALPTILGSGRVQVSLRPFHGRLEAGGVRYTAAATALDLAPGETVVVAETEQADSGEALDTAGAASRWESRVERVLLLSVEVEP